MMRVMRKILKRKVCIVMALLVILGIAVYGVSAFAEEQTATTTPFTINKDYIYLNPTGMKLSDADWTNKNAEIWLNVTKWDEKHKGTYDSNSGYWYWDATNWEIKDGNTYFFTYGTDWGVINSKPYYRTEVSSDILAKGKVYAQNGPASTKIEDQDVYALKEYTSNAGQSLTFVDMKASNLSGVQAQFSLDGNYDASTSEHVTALQLSDGKVTVPNDVNGKAYQYVRFIDAQNNAITDSFDISTAISKGGILYYGIRQDSSKTYSEWSQEKKSETTPNVTKLYFNNLSFRTSDDITIQIGSGEPVKVVPDDTATNTLSYNISGTIDKDTIISITKNGVTYRFYPNGTDNLITYSGSNICIKGTYQASSLNTVYFDATLSKLSYAGDVTNNSLPLKDAGIRYHAWNNENDFKDGDLKKLEDFSDGTHTWSDVYQAALDKKYSYILFYSSTDGTIPSTPTANKTYDLTIPADLTNPCFYADTSDDSIYKPTNRSGYWGELYTVRNAEGKTKDGGSTATSDTIVDIPQGTLTRNSSMLYVNTTLYDYYSDYELNGYNRDAYSYKTDLNSLGNNPILHYIYQPFRQLDQALSSYYDKNNASSSIYWGNFQNYKGSHYSDIKASLNLYGSGDWNKFIYENNSMWGRNGYELSNGNSAVQGLVADTLSNNNLMIKTSGKTVAAPYFNEDFLTGNNSKNTVLGKVYKDVTFPFVKKPVTSTSYKGSVDYWYFDSADNNASNKNLQLQQSVKDGYFLNPSDQAVKGQTASPGYPATNDNNYFPFNTNAQSGNATMLNYGFGQKFDLKFKLTSDGTVKTTDNEDAPIEFNFSGDDDVWVFIDGKLVLDVGGGHGKVNGTINFKDKKATVSSVKNDATGGGVTPSKVNSFASDETITKDYFTKEHTLTMFYMERGLWESNMSISFNFPDENEFQVEKNVDTAGVNKDIFPDTLFDNTSVFPFTIQNQATHFGIKKATAGQSIKTEVFNDTFESNKVQNVSGNTFEKVNNWVGQTNVVHWLAQLDNVGGSYKKRRWGSILPAGSDSFNATYTAGSATDHYKYLQFKFYYDYKDNPSTQFMYIGLEDSDGKQAGNYLTNDVATANSSLTNKKWITVNVEIDKLIGSSQIDLSKIRYIRFNYDYSRDFYLDDFKFIPSSEVTNPTGFVTKQYEIADYGSVESGTLMYPENAVYTISSDKSSTTNILGDDGVFVLANGETATFTDQFRRGSYIAVSEDVDTEVFEPSWTMYENGEPVTAVNSEGTTVDLSSVTANLTNQSGSTIKDGRKEKYKTGAEDGHQINNDGLDITNARSSGKTIGYPGTNSVVDSSAWARKNGNVNTYDENTIVFRSYSDPDNSTTSTRLKVKYTNKVKTGTITIQKQQAAVSDDLKGTYTFKVKFFNVAGMGLEGTTPIEKEYTVTKNAQGKFDPIVIAGIPAGTQYTISEISASDNAVLESVDVSSGYTLEEKYQPTDTYNETTKLTEVSGTVKADAADKTIFIFTNKLKPVINIDLTKKWDKATGETIPASINIQLQRRVKDSDNWEAVKYATPGQTAADYITLKKDPYNPDKTEWTFSFTGLDRYANDTDGKVDNTKLYMYRIVEVTVADGSVKVIDNNEYLNDLFKVTYTDAISAPSTEVGSSITKNYTITNTYSPLTNIKITKVDATDTTKRLNGVEFKLERLLPDSTSSTGGDSFKVDPNFTAITVTTGGTDGSVGTAQGIAEFKDLKDGTYRLTETKAVQGYNLLKDPITIKILRNNVTTVDGQSYDFTKATDKNTIELQISNRIKFLLPKTGGYGAMLFILCGMALATLGCLIFFLITLRKEVQYSRLKRQRRNAIGK